MAGHSNIRVPFLVGPTASGKTSIAIEVAERIGAEIISADSRQVYKGMAIGSAQPTLEETSRVPHHFVNCLEIDRSFSAGDYGRQARERVIELYEKGITPFVVGGSGLYISALADDFFEGPSADEEIRSKLKSWAESDGIEKLYEKLKKIDPPSAEKIMPNDYRRIERALEIYYLTGMPITEVRKQKSNPPPYRPMIVGLSWPREELYQRINERTLQMLELGLLEEVKSLVADKDIEAPDFFDRYNALNSVGYAEVIGYLRNEYDHDEMLRLIQRNTRRFAKRQISWFGRDERIHWVEANQGIDVTDIIIETYGKDV